MENRTIKFRAWDATRMIYDKDRFTPKRLQNYDSKYFGPAEVYHNKVCMWFYESQLPMATSEHFDHLTYISVESIMQFTGLLDKNGKEIYEGDIVGRYCVSGDEFSEHYNPGALLYKGIIQFDNTCAAFVLRQGLGFKIEKNQLLEIIGNIHQNPELLTTNPS